MWTVVHSVSMRSTFSASGGSRTSAFDWVDFSSREQPSGRRHHGLPTVASHHNGTRGRGSDKISLGPKAADRAELMDETPQKRRRGDGGDGVLHFVPRVNWLPHRHHLRRLSYNVRYASTAPPYPLPVFSFW
jgi:hypothetical protein